MQRFLYNSRSISFMKNWMPLFPTIGDPCNNNIVVISDWAHKPTRNIKIAVPCLINVAFDRNAARVIKTISQRTSNRHTNCNGSKQKVSIYIWPLNPFLFGPL